jgi:hypothetical protein
MRDATISDTGCYLDNHRGHYITRDMIELAQSFGFIVGPAEQFMVSMYDLHNHEDYYPHETLVELGDAALEWLNSGQYSCNECGGTGEGKPNGLNSWLDKDHNWRCKTCTGTGRGPRIEGQNFPPRIPDGHVWCWNDGDFGLYAIEDAE